jgi:hypothetical protein
MRLSAVLLERGDECLLRDVDLAELAHLLPKAASRLSKHSE